MNLPNTAVSLGRGTAGKSRAPTGAAAGGAGVAGGGGKKPKPPEWAVERWVKTIGKIPAAAGRALDQAAKWPIIGRVVRLFSSVVFGLSILASIAIYIAIGSGFASLRAYLEMTDLQFFDAWPMRILLMLLVTDLSIVTLRRIPMTLFKLGSWTVHIGIVTLITGCVIYFGLKEEGMARIYLNQSVDTVFDQTERGLYAFPMNDQGEFDTAHAVWVPMPGLPYFGDRLAQDGKGLDISLGNAGLAGISPALKDVKVRVVEYYSAAELVAIGAREALPGEKATGIKETGRHEAGPGETGVGAAVELAFDSAQGPFGNVECLMDTPARRVLEADGLPFALEYLNRPTAQRVKELQTSFNGNVALTVRVPKLGIERTYVAQPDVPIVVEGSPYTLTPKSMEGNNMISKGYEGAFSTSMMVGISRREPDGKIFQFDRQALFRYPERSPDWLPLVGGPPKRVQDGVDPDIQIVLHDATKLQFWLIDEGTGTGGAEKYSMIRRAVGGQSTTYAFDADGSAPLEVPGVPPLRLKVARRLNNAVVESKNMVTIMGPMAIPMEQRKGESAADAIFESIAVLEVEGPGGWKQENVAVPFSQFAAVKKWGDARDPGKDPTVVDVPVALGTGTAGGGAVRFGLLMATVQRPLPVAVTLRSFQAEKYPGAVMNYLDYHSMLEFKDKETGTAREQEIHLNEPARDHGLTYFQAAWDGVENATPERRFSVVGIGNRPGTWGMISGAGLIVLGIGYAFYAKPILLRKKKADLAAWAKTDGNTKG